VKAYTFCDHQLEAWLFGDYRLSVNLKVSTIFVPISGLAPLSLVYGSGEHYRILKDSQCENIVRLEQFRAATTNQFDHHQQKTHGRFSFPNYGSSFKFNSNSQFYIKSLFLGFLTVVKHKFI